MSRCAGSGDAFALDAQLRGLVALEDGLERRLGDLLREMSAQGAWSELGFAGCSPHAEQRLALSRSVAGDRLRASRLLRRFPHVGRAHEAGEIGLEPALGIAMVLDGARRPGGRDGRRCRR